MWLSFSSLNGETCNLFLKKYIPSSENIQVSVHQLPVSVGPVQFRVVINGNWFWGDFVLDSAYFLHISWFI